MKAVPTYYFDKIDPRICVNAKLRKLHRLLNSVYEKKFNPFGLQGSTLTILFAIGKMKKVNQKTVAEMLAMSQSTMSRDMKKLVAKGWLQIHRGKDLRHSELELTRKCILYREL